MIEDLQDQHTVQTMCEVLDVSKSSYYQSSHKAESKREKTNNQLKKRIYRNS